MEPNYKKLLESLLEYIDWQLKGIDVADMSEPERNIFNKAEEIDAAFHGEY